MRVALLTPGGVDRTAGERSFPYLLALIERLASRHDVQVFALHQEAEPSRYELLGATVHNGGAHGPTRRRAYWRTFRAVLAEHRRRPFDLLHALWLVPPGLIAASAGALARRPVLVHLAGGELVSLPEIGYGWRVSWRTRLWGRLALAGTTRLTAASTPMVESAAMLGYHAERVPFGVDLTRWPVTPPRPRGDRDARLLHIGNLNPVKDQEMLIRAAALLSARGEAFRLDIAGLDTTGGAVAAAARRFGIGHRVHFRGYLSQARLRLLAERADLLWVTSRHEAGPFAMLEAAVAGVPTVGTAVGHVLEWSPESAVAVPVGDAEAMARETAHLIAHDALRVELATIAQRRAVREDADWTARRVEEIYGEMISAASARGPGR